VGLKGWWEPADISTLFQDTAAATPISADLQTLGRINDKSGNGLNLTQATAANRPTYRTGTNPKLTFDGVNDILQSAVGQTFCDANGQWAMIMAIKLAALTDQIQFVADNVGGSALTETFLTTTVTTGVPRSQLRLANTSNQFDSAAALDTAQPYVLFAQAVNGSPSTVELFKDGVSDGSSNNGGTTIQSGTAQLYIGDYPGNGTPFSGDLFFAAIVAGTLTAGERANLITYAGSKCGRSL
jgi:hypothetical protein